KYGGDDAISCHFPLNTAALEQFIDKRKRTAIAGCPGGVRAFLSAPVEQCPQFLRLPKHCLACDPALEVAFGLAIFPDRLRLAPLPFLQGIPLADEALVADVEHGVGRHRLVGRGHQQAAARRTEGVGYTRDFLDRLLADRRYLG